VNRYAVGVMITGGGASAHPDTPVDRRRNFQKKVFSFGPAWMVNSDMIVVSSKMGLSEIIRELEVVLDQMDFLFVSEIPQGAKAGCAGWLVDSEGLSALFPDLDL